MKTLSLSFLSEEAAIEYKKKLEKARYKVTIQKRKEVTTLVYYDVYLEYMQ